MATQNSPIIDVDSTGHTLDHYMIEFIPLHQDDDFDSSTLRFWKMKQVYDWVRKNNFEVRVRKWIKSILKLVDDPASCIVAVAPGHSPSSPTPVLSDLFASSKLPNKIVFVKGLLKRVEKVPKSTDGGPRDQALHETTIGVDDGVTLQGKTVYIFDDVWTSGATLRACGNLVKQAGANKVVLCAVGKTI